MPNDLGHTAPIAQRSLVCDQCGREGTRGFEVIEPVETEFGPTPRFVVCANKNACRKRWPQPSQDYLDALYA